MRDAMRDRELDASCISKPDLDTSRQILHRNVWTTLLSIDTTANKNAGCLATDGCRSAENNQALPLTCCQEQQRAPSRVQLTSCLAKKIDTESTFSDEQQILKKDEAKLFHEKQKCSLPSTSGESSNDSDKLNENCHKLRSDVSESTEVETGRISCHFPVRNSVPDSVAQPDSQTWSEMYADWSRLMTLLKLNTVCNLSLTAAANQRKASGHGPWRSHDNAHATLTSQLQSQMRQKNAVSNNPGETFSLMRHSDVYKITPERSSVISIPTKNGNTTQAPSSTTSPQSAILQKERSLAQSTANTFSLSARSQPIESNHGQQNDHGARTKHCSAPSREWPQSYRSNLVTRDSTMCQHSDVTGVSSLHTPAPSVESEKTAYHVLERNSGKLEKRNLTKQKNAYQWSKQKQNTVRSLLQKTRGHYGDDLLQPRRRERWQRVKPALRHPSIYKPFSLPTPYSNVLPLFGQTNNTVLSGSCHRQSLPTWPAGCPNERDQSALICPSNQPITRQPDPRDGICTSAERANKYLNDKFEGSIQEKNTDDLSNLCKSVQTSWLPAIKNEQTEMNENEIIAAAPSQENYNLTSVPAQKLLSLSGPKQKADIIFLMQKCATDKNNKYNGNAQNETERSKTVIGQLVNGAAATHQAGGQETHSSANLDDSKPLDLSLSRARQDYHEPLKTAEWRVEVNANATNSDSGIRGDVTGRTCTNSCFSETQNGATVESDTFTTEACSSGGSTGGNVPEQTDVPLMRTMLNSTPTATFYNDCSDGSDGAEKFLGTGHISDLSLSRGKTSEMTQPTKNVTGQIQSKLCASAKRKLCDGVNVALRDPNVYVKTLSFHEKQNYYECEFCDILFKDCVIYRAHMQIHIKKPPRPID